MERFFIYTNSPVGDIGIGEREEYVRHLLFSSEEDLKDQVKEDYIIEETQLIKLVKKQLDEYFEGTRKQFDLPLMPEGTDFQKKVWEALTEIPYGETTSYKEIGQKIGCPKGSRAVGLANNRNPIAVIIPCHRVIGGDGKLVGYGGGLPIKEKLLTLEGVVVKNDKLFSKVRK